MRTIFETGFFTREPWTPRLGFDVEDFFQEVIEEGDRGEPG